MSRKPQKQNAAIPKQSYRTEAAGGKLRRRVLVAYVFLFPLLAGEGGFFGLVPEYAPLFAATALAVVICMWSILSNRHRFINGLQSPCTVFVLLFTSWAGGSVFWSISYDHSAYLFIPIATGCMIFLAYREESVFERFSTPLLRALVASTAVLSLVAIYQAVDMMIRVRYHLPPEGMQWEMFLAQARSYRPNSLFKDPNTFGSFLSILFPLNIHLIINGVKSRLRLFFCATAMLNAAGLFFVASRGPAVLVIAALLAVAVFEWKRNEAKRPDLLRLLLGAAAAVAVLAALQFFFGMQGRPSLVSRLIDIDEMAGNALSNRLAYWLAALRAFWEHPVLGTGVNTLQQNIYTHLVHGTFTRFPHNILLQFMAELGAIGALFFSLLVASVMLRGYRRARTEPVAFYSMVSFSVLLAYALFDITFQCSTVVFIFFLLAALVAGAHSERSALEHEKRLPSRFRRTATAALLLPAAVCVLFSVYESTRVFNVRCDLDSIHGSIPHEKPVQIRKRYDEAIKSRHILVYNSCSAWFMGWYENSGSEELFERAIEMAGKAYERGGRNPCDAFRIARAFMDAGQYNEAHCWYKAAVQRFPSSLSIWLGHLQAMEKLGMEDEVIRLIPGLLQGMSEIKDMGRYYIIERFRLELMMAAIYERHEYRQWARNAYLDILERYGHLEYIEEHDPMNGTLIRLPIAAKIEEVYEKALNLGIWLDKNG